MKKDPIQNEEGFILMLTMMLLVVLSLIGLTVVRSSRIEVKVAGNEKWSQDSFYQGDSGVETVISLIEDNADGRDVKNNSEYRAVYVNADNFDMISTSKKTWKEEGDSFTNSENFLVASPETGTNGRPAAMNGNTLASFPATQLQVTKHTGTPTGSELKTVPGSDSTPGSSSAEYTIWAHNDGVDNSETDLQIRWRHVD